MTLKTKLMKYGVRKGAYKLAGVQDEDKSIRAHQQQKVLYSSTLILPLANFNSNHIENKRTLLRTEQPSASKVGGIKKTGGAFLSKVQEDRHLSQRENNSIFKSQNQLIVPQNVNRQKVGGLAENPKIEVGGRQLVSSSSSR